MHRQLSTSTESHLIRDSFENDVASLSSLSRWKPDRARVLASQLASKGYFAGEAAGLRLAFNNGKTFSLVWSGLVYTDTFTLYFSAEEALAKNPPLNAPSIVLRELEKKMLDMMESIRSKNSNLVIDDLKRLLFRCAATLISLEKVFSLVFSLQGRTHLEHGSASTAYFTFWSHYRSRSSPQLLSLQVLKSGPGSSQNNLR